MKGWRKWESVPERTGNCSVIMKKYLVISSHGGRIQEQQICSKAPGAARTIKKKQVISIR